MPVGYPSGNVQQTDARFRREVRGDAEIGEVTHHTGSFRDMAVKSSPIGTVKRPSGGLQGMEESQSWRGRSSTEARGEGVPKQKVFNPGSDVKRWLQRIWIEI